MRVQDIILVIHGRCRSRTGIFRFNNASIALTTVIFIDVLDSIDMTTYIDSWNTGTSQQRVTLPLTQIQIQVLFIVYFNLIV
jgi:hypothetical protein